MFKIISCSRTWKNRSAVGNFNDRSQGRSIGSKRHAQGNYLICLVNDAVRQPGKTESDNYFLYYEEADFCERAKKRGYRIFYAPKAIVWHKNARSVGGVGSELQDYYTTRNRLLFGVKYAPYRAKIALIRESFGLLKSGRKWQKRGVMDFYLGRFGKGSYAK